MEQIFFAGSPQLKCVEILQLMGHGGHDDQSRVISALNTPGLVGRTASWGLANQIDKLGGDREARKV